MGRYNILFRDEFGGTLAPRGIFSILTCFFIAILEKLITFERSFGNSSKKLGRHKSLDLKNFQKFLSRTEIISSGQRKVGIGRIVVSLDHFLEDRVTYQGYFGDAPLGGDLTTSGKKL